jgi:HK97 family phage prohead protease
VWDFDEIVGTITRHGPHEDRNAAQTNMALKLRYTYAKNIPESDVDVGWFICTRPDDTIRELLGEDAEYIEMDATEEECLQRLDDDDSRQDKDYFRKLIRQYYEEKKEGRSAMNRDGMEMRTFIGSVESRAAENDDQIHLEGTPIVFNQSTDIAGWWEEVIEPTAIDEETLRDVRLLVNHDFSGIPLARSRRNTPNATMRLFLRPEEVHMEADLDAKNPKAVELNSAIKRGDISGMSFAFLVDGERWDRLDSDYPKRTITHISEIFEVSVVNEPAYSQTSISSRSLESGKKSLEEARAALESAKKRSAKIAELNQRLEEIQR